MSSRRQFAGKRPKIKGQFFAHTIDMLKSPAFRTLSRSGYRALSRLEIELANHAGNNNGNLVVTFDDFEAYGIHRHAVAPAIRELVALGFVEITEHGCAGNAYERNATKYRLTMTAVGTTYPTNEWKKIDSLEEAECIAAAARAAKNKVQWRKSSPGPVAKTTTENPKSPVAKTALPADFPSVENHHYYLESPGGSTEGEAARAAPPAPPASLGARAQGGPSEPEGPAAPTAGQQLAASERANRERRSEASGVLKPRRTGARLSVSQITRADLESLFAVRRARYANGSGAKRE